MRNHVQPCAFVRRIHTENADFSMHLQSNAKR
nr:MAG TPA: hypothetical protein [Caudoviricetes sp.]